MMESRHRSDFGTTSYLALPTTWTCRRCWIIGAHSSEAKILRWNVELQRPGDDGAHWSESTEHSVMQSRLYDTCIVGGQWGFLTMTTDTLSTVGWNITFR